ncbi:DUF3987 domain-containing protein [Ochrobactrum chromiisoli]|uniref:DUF3987 domain-containing protein n=1 Tax=Ochrobactrum chromiisoli TaxID=2993941 RepID=A0ABT3QKP6_9HYPH|nr:DUF3987 domain-containing protein [Ochrobactrum chromiisoli]MCX2696187.1 DUF3987 domain-containing protein [Ochrobactrum chromiisoli]
MTEIALQREAHSASAIRQHVELLHNAAKGVDGVLVVSTFFASPNREDDRPGTVTHHNVGDVDGMVDAIEAHAETPEANVYVGLQVMRKGLGRGKRGTESDIVAVLGLVADMDADTGKIGQMPFDPSFVLQTSPGNKQPFWIFDKPLAPTVAKPIAAALRRATSSDFGTADISHVWRIPGTLNWPNAKKIERGRDREPAKVTVLQEWDGSFVDTTSFAVTVGAAAGALPAETRAVSIGDLPDVADIIVSGAAEELLQGDGQPDRSTHAARVVERLSFDGHTPEEALALIKACEGKWKERYATEERLDADFARMWGKFEKHDDAPTVDTSKLEAGSKASVTPANDNFPEPIDIWSETTSPSMPINVFPEVIEEFARARGDQMGVDPGGIAMACLTICAAAIPDNLTLKMKVHESWKESARIWTMIVGDPSTRKSPIIKVASAPLMKIEADLQQDNRLAMKQWMGLSKDEQKGRSKPIEKRIATEDSSPEKVGEILSHNENGLALIDDELSGWFARMEKYAGAKGSGADRAFWLKSFGGGHYSVDRIGRGSIWVPNISITLLGGIQPDPLTKIAKDLTDDGLLQRMFCIMLAPSGIDRDEPSAVGENVYGDLISRLYDLRTKYMAGKCFKFSADAQCLRSDLAAKHHEMELNWSRINKRIATHIGKFDGLFGRLALLIHIVEHIYDTVLPNEVSLKTACKAQSLLHDYLFMHAIALHFNVLGASDMQDAVLDAAGSILTNERLRDVVSVSSLRKWSTRMIRELDDWEMQRVMQRLDGFSWLEPKQLERNEKSPRYTVNPRVHSKFSDRAAPIAAERQAIREEIQRYAS